MYLARGQIARRIEVSLGLSKAGREVPGEEAFTTPAESKCAVWK